MNTANLRKLLDAATPRPWTIKSRFPDLIDIYAKDGSVVAVTLRAFVGILSRNAVEANAALIVKLVNSADELLDENERLRAALLFIRDKEQAALNEAERLRFNIPEDAGCMEILHAARAALEQKS